MSKACTVAPRESFQSQKHHSLRLQDFTRHVLSTEHMLLKEVTSNCLGPAM